MSTNGIFQQAEKSKRERIEKESGSKFFNKSSGSGELAEVQKKLNKSEQDVKKLTTDLEGVRTSYDSKLKGSDILV